MSNETDSKEETPEEQPSEGTTEVPVESTSLELGNKKAKRTAERQLTKDDEEGDDDNDYVGAPFAKASAEVLAGRKIRKARRPEQAAAALTAPLVKPSVSNGAVSPNGAPSTATTSNPFANTVLTLSSNPTPTATTTATAATSTTSSDGSAAEKKIFGSGFGSGFAAAANSSNNEKNVVAGGFGAGFAGFGTAIAGTGTGTSASTDTTVGGFGAAAAAAASNKDSFVFGKSSSTSLFTVPSSAAPGSGGSSMFSFGFGKTSSTAATSNATSTGSANTSDSKTTPSMVLPDQVELANGEEQELNLHEARCKTYKWVPDVADDDADDNDGQTSSSTTTPKEAAPPSVPSSNSFQVGQAKEATQKQKEEDTNDKASGPAAKSLSDTSNLDTTAASFRWQEIGVGPLKLLQDDESNPPKYRLVQRRESTPNGPATKVLLNLPIYRESKASLKQGQENYLSFCTIGPEGVTETYLWKFKEVAQARHFCRALEGVLVFAKSCFGTAK